MRHHRACLAALAGLGAAILFSGTARAGIKIHVSWTWVQVRIAPSEGVETSRGGLTFTLEGGRVRSGDHNLRADAAFGQQALFTNSSGHAYTSIYTISSGRIINTARFPGHSIRTVVSTDGSTACRAAVSNIVTGGRSIPVGNSLYSKMYAENVNCEIASE